MSEEVKQQTLEAETTQTQAKAPEDIRIIVRKEDLEETGDLEWDASIKSENGKAEVFLPFIIEQKENAQNENDVQLIVRGVAFPKEVDSQSENMSDYLFTMIIDITGDGKVDIKVSNEFNDYFKAHQDESAELDEAFKSLVQRIDDVLGSLKNQGQENNDDEVADQK